MAELKFENLKIKTEKKNNVKEMMMGYATMQDCIDTESEMYRMVNEIAGTMKNMTLDQQKEVHKTFMDKANEMKSVTKVE